MIKRRFYFTLLMVLILTILQACTPANPPANTKTAPQKTRTAAAENAQPPGSAKATASATRGNLLPNLNAPTQDPQGQMPPAVITEVAGVEPVAPQATDDPGSPEEQGTPANTAVPPKTPSELTVTYTDADGNLWVWTSAGGSKQLTTNGGILEMRMSEDGTRIAFVRAPDFTDYSLWVINTDGSNEIQLVTSDELDQIVRAPISDPDTLDAVTGGMIFMFKWVPGTHTIAFTTSPLLDSPESLPTNNLWLVNVDKGEKSELLTPGNGGLFFFSLDGTQIALSYSNKISLVNADGSNRRDAVITFSEVVTESEMQFIPTPVWSIDSSKLFVAIPPADPQNIPEDLTSVYSIDVASGSATLVASVNTQPLALVEFSPNAAYFAYVRDVGDPVEGNSELHIVNSDGSNDQVYYSGMVLFNNWAPDSNSFIFALEGDTNLQYAKVGGAFLQMTDQDYPQSVTWVKNNLVLFLNQADENWEIYLGEPGQGSTLIVKLDGDPYNFDPAYDFHD